MAEIKLTKNELRSQQKTLTQLRRYLPTLQLKKAMLQSEIYQARVEITQFSKEFKEAEARAQVNVPLLAVPLSIDPLSAAKVQVLNRRYENIAGIDVPYFESIEFAPFEYALFDTPPWLEGLIEILQEVTRAQCKVEIAKEKREALEEELRQVSIRVNLFEKFLIPRALKNIKKIKVFLGDQELAAVCQAKAAKKIIVQNQEKKSETCASM